MQSKLFRAISCQQKRRWRRTTTQRDGAFRFVQMTFYRSFSPFSFSFDYYYYHSFFQQTHIYSVSNTFYYYFIFIFWDLSVFTTICHSVSPPSLAFSFSLFRLLFVVLCFSPSTICLLSNLLNVSVCEGSRDSNKGHSFGSAQQNHKRQTRRNILVKGDAVSVRRDLACAVRSRTSPPDHFGGRNGRGK